MEDKYRLFAELLCTKFCYFLSEALSSINSSISFVSYGTTDAQIRSMAFVTFKVKESINKMTFLKYAYCVMHHGYELPIEDIDAMIKNFLHGTSLSFNMDSTFENSINLKLTKLIYNLIIIVSEFMLYSGTLTVLIDKTITITGTYIDNKQDVNLNIINGTYTPDQINIKNVHHAYTKAITHSMNYCISLQKMPNQLIITLTPPNI